MRAMPLVALLGSLLPWFISRAEAQSDFQGIITYKTITDKTTGEATIFVKGKKSRQETSGGGRTVITITDQGAAKTTTLMPEQRKYMVMDFKAIAKAAGPIPRDPAGAKTATNGPKVGATGKKETIAGHTCENYRLAGGTTTLELCIATDLGFLSLGGMSSELLNAAAASNPEYGRLIAQFKDGFFPLRTSVLEGGKVVMASEVTKVEKKSISDDLFLVPPGYQEIRLPGLGGRRP